MAAFIDSLITKTNPTPYHQLVVLSQLMINNGLYNMWAIADDSSPLHTLPDVTVDGAGGLPDGQLKAPIIRLHVASMDGPQLWYYVNFDSGTLKLYDTEKNDTMKSWDVSGWSFAFPVVICQ
jgi:hypothetical protein